MDKLFFGIWRNVYLNDQIFQHLKLIKKNIYIKLNNQDDFKNLKLNIYYPFVVELHTKIYFNFDALPNLYRLQIENKNNSYNNILEIKIPQSVKELIYNLDSCIKISSSSVETLIFGFKFNQPLSAGVIPPSVETLIFGEDFNQPLSAGVIPSSVKKIIFGEYFNQIITKDVLPCSIKYLVFGNKFKKEVFLPESVKKVYFVNNEYDLGLCVYNKNKTILEINNKKLKKRKRE
ncbi:hypothetical protein DICPUDRAFT_80380 [Dictyostelium purpureum]|uniref:FNIp repeat-containing protein n=1 Tax=Dictyostelium purpureum TaxID=5786 RepID=F0ZQB1_DICPU|nr:uncharacterized protein DICPUDRAFT_80380 [Dictyostelium purpureum]EGC33860.1 hypothetical protein DICPUDRAFT_80380 [Dictyostelium purpureum]|eukprot:XP_003289598.1 hypothetical protein DICPUDRAFT_80380 [Dictyostelium purpureum]